MPKYLPDQALPVLLSVPHAGLRIPEEIAELCVLSREELIRDSDEGAAEIYDLAEQVLRFETTDIARAVIDLNRDEADRRADGIVKTHTCWNIPIYRSPLPSQLAEELIAKFYRPYHQRLDDVDDTKIGLCVDCHTMAEFGPPIGPDPDSRRPHVCLGDGGGTTLPNGWMSRLQQSFETCFGQNVSVNQPFQGGFITRCHGQQRPWFQLELSRGPFMSNAEKRIAVLRSLEIFCQQVF